MLNFTKARMRSVDQFWVPILVVATFLAVPISTTAKSIFLMIAVVFILFFPVYRPNLKNLLSLYWCRACLFVVFLVACGCFWSPATWVEKILVFEKFSKLLYIPILVVAFKEQKFRKYALQAFLFAMAITCLVSFGKFSGLFFFHDLDPGRVFRNHIMTGYMMAFAAYLSAFLFFRCHGKIRIIYGLGLILFSYQVLFINTGRTGYIIYILLMMLLAIQMLSLKHFLLAALLGACTLFMIYAENSNVHTRVDQLYWDWQQYQQNNKSTSVGYRLQFHEYAKELFNHHPWIGNGTSSFTYLYSQDKPVPTWERRLLEPHSLYWLIAAELGILGLISLALLFGSLFLAALRLDSMRPIAIAVLLPFIIGNLSDSLLFYSGTGYFFVLFMALCLSEDPLTVVETQKDELQCPRMTFTMQQ
jgi:O-antigen ligase